MLDVKNIYAVLCVSWLALQPLIVLKLFYIVCNKLLILFNPKS